MKYIYTQTFKDIDSTSLGIAGGKGSNLGEMSKAGFPVPPGFIIDTAAYDDFINSYSGMEELYSKLDNLESDNLDQIRKVGKLIRKTIVKIDMPGNLENEVRERLNKIGEKDYFAVRSSATAEDLPGASFAGQQDTFLNIRGLENILINIRKCWVSLFTDRAILYRIEKGFSHRDVKLSAVVQQMVFPDSSGIMFTADPLSGHRNKISIDAGFGLGEALVSGLITPDLYKVDKGNLSIIKKEVNDKKLQIISVPEGGTRTENLEESISKSPALDDRQIVELAKMGKKIEEHYGAPQDIEWCFEKGELFIVQSRPITSLFPVPEIIKKDNALHVFISFGHFQMMTETMPEMAHSLLKLFFPFGKKRKPGEYNPFFISAGGRLFIDLSPLLFRPKLRNILTGKLAALDPLISGAVSEVVSREEFISKAKKSKAKIGIKAPGGILLPIIFKGIKIHFFEDSTNRTEDIFKSFDLKIGEIRRELEFSKTNQEKLLAGRNALDHFMKTLINIFPNIIQALIAINKIHKMFPGEVHSADILALQRGLKGNVTTEMDLIIGDLADVIKESPKLPEILSESEDIKKTILSLENNGEYKLFTNEWHKFMDLYGFRGVGEIDISRPRWQDDPSSIMKVIMGSMKNDETGSHRIHYNNLAEEAELATVRLLKKADSGVLGRFKKRKLRRLIKDYRNFLPLREHGKYFVIKLFGILRELILNEAGELKAEGRIDEVSDIWFLSYNELVDTVTKSSEDIRAVISKRKKEMKIFESMKPPRVITSDGEIPVAKHTGTYPDGALPGAGVSAGIATGTARVLIDPHSEILHPGEILVAPYTDPAWTPLFINAAAVVIEVGGLMTHGSVIAREYGIPAVVSIENATTLIKTGQKIRVNGDLGYVEVIEE